MEKVKKFLEELRNSPRAAELMSADALESPAGMIKKLAGLARELGHDVEEGDLIAFYENALKERSEKSDSAAEKILAESDQTLDTVGGGLEDAPENGDSCGTIYQSCFSQDKIHLEAASFCQHGSFMIGGVGCQHGSFTIQGVGCDHSSFLMPEPGSRS